MTLVYTSHFLYHLHVLIYQRSGFNRGIGLYISIWPVVSKIVSEYDQEIPQSQIADNPVAPRGRAAQPSRDTRKTK